MNYPLLSEYIDAIKAAEDNFDELKHFHPVLDDDGQPIMSSGNFAVVFKMKDEQTGKLHAVKCFLKEQEGRAEAYRLITEELEFVSSTFLTPIKYLDKELFVDSNASDETEFPVLLMDWVDGMTLDKYILEHIDNQYELSLLAYQFSQLAMWLMPQPFAHGDLKPDNILVKDDGTLVLVDYDGMYVPAMKGQKARELGSPDYRHPTRNLDCFDNHIDDFSLALIAVTLKAFSLSTDLYKKSALEDHKLFVSNRHFSIQDNEILTIVNELLDNNEFRILYGIFLLVLSKGYLPKALSKYIAISPPEVDDDYYYSGYYWKTKIIFCRGDIIHDDVPEWLQDIKETELKYCYEDYDGVKYNEDRTVLLDCDIEANEYYIPEGVKRIREKAFYTAKIKRLYLPSSLELIEYRGLFSYGIQNIICTDNNPNFKSILGVLYSKDEKTLVAYPQGKVDIVYKMPDSVVKVEDGVFSSDEDFKFNFNRHDVISGDPDVYTDYGFCSFRECNFINNNWKPINYPYVIINKKIHKKIAPSTRIITSNDVYLDNGVVYTANKETLLFFNPFLTMKDYHVIDGCVNIWEYSFPDFNYFDTRSQGGENISNDLERIHLPKSLKSIGTGAFSRCYNLKQIYVLSDKFDEMTNLLPSPYREMLTC